MKESRGFKESASFTNSETCMLGELILSLSMGHLCEFFTWEKTDPLLSSVCVCAAPVSINCQIPEESTPWTIVPEPAAQQILQLCICNCAIAKPAVEHAKSLGDFPPPWQLFWLIQLCWQVLPVSTCYFQNKVDPAPSKRLRQWRFPFVAERCI